MIKIIALSITIVFSLAFFILLSFDEYYGAPQVSDIKNNDFFLKKLDSNSNKIFTMGGSGVGQLNSTFIHNSIQERNDNYVFYNLAYNADTPKQRFESLETTISQNPELVLYGITYYDFNGFEFILKPEREDPLPNIKDSIKELFMIKIDPMEQINPKENTLNFIRQSFSDHDIFQSSNERFQINNSPFVFFSNYQTIIASDAELQKITPETVANRVNQNVKSHSEQVLIFEKIIKSFTENNIKIVVFVLPQQEYYSDLIPESDKTTFYSTIKQVQQKYNFPFYDFSNNYDDLDIWQDHTHVAYNKNSMIFSEDVLKIIFEELENVI